MAQIGEDAGACAVVVAQEAALDFAVVQLGAGVPAYGMADAAEAVGAGLLEGFEDGADGGAELEVGAADDAVGGAGGAVLAGGGGVG